MPLGPAANDSASVDLLQSRSEASLRGFFAIADAWGLSVEEQLTLLGSPARSTLFKWKREGGQPAQDTLERISYILGIYKALHILFPDPQTADAWIRRPNSGPLFNGVSALQLMLAGKVADLFVVRRYLDAQRGG